MKKLLLLFHLPLLFAFTVPALAADPSPPIADFEPRSILPAGASQTSARPRAVLNDAAFIAPTGPQTSANTASSLRDDDF